MRAKRVLYRCILMLFTVCTAMSCSVAVADDECAGRFMDPVVDVCWSCIFPITIGQVPLMRSKKFNDTQNSSVPTCNYRRGSRQGLAVGFWEPTQVIEVTRTPYCLISMGGQSGGYGRRIYGSFRKTHSEALTHSHAFYHTHHFAYQVLMILNLLTDFNCMTDATSGADYMSELDPAYSSDALMNMMHPETFLFTNSAAYAVCAMDCVQVSKTKLPLDEAFWCSGCQGSIYPLTGYTANHISGVATSQLLVTRQLERAYKFCRVKKPATDFSGLRADMLCTNKSQYRTQMVYPRANVTGEYSCNPIGMSDSFYSSGREFPHGGEDFSYIIWEKRSCCLF